MYRADAAFPAHRIFGELGWKEFQRHRLAQLQIVCPVDFTHPAAAEQPDNAVAVGKDGSGCEPASRHGIRGDNPPYVG